MPFDPRAQGVVVTHSFPQPRYGSLQIPVSLCPSGHELAHDNATFFLDVLLSIPCPWEDPKLGVFQSALSIAELNYAAEGPAVLVVKPLKVRLCPNQVFERLIFLRLRLDIFGASLSRSPS